MSAHTLRIVADNASAAGVLLDAAALRQLAGHAERVEQCLRDAYTLLDRRRYVPCNDGDTDNDHEVIALCKRIEVVLK